MQFYTGSTQLTLQQNKSLSDTLQGQSQHGEGLSSVTQPFYLYLFNNYCHQFLQLSSFLNQELLLNNTLMDIRAVSSAQTSGKQQLVSECQVRTTDLDKNASQSQEPLEDYKIVRTKQNKMPRRRVMRDDIDETDSYKPEDDFSKEVAMGHTSESKNIPKNYGKAIVIFIQKSEHYTRSVLKHLGIDYDAFMKHLNTLKKNLNTIKQLRSMWLQEENLYAKAFRIFSLEYLRKHSLSYIFNSRVQNFHKHIKYRYKMIESVRDPKNFTHMKEF